MYVSYIRVCYQIIGIGLFVLIVRFCDVKHTMQSSALWDDNPDKEINAKRIHDGKLVEPEKKTVFYYSSVDGNHSSCEDAISFQIIV